MIHFEALSLLHDVMISKHHDDGIVAKSLRRSITVVTLQLKASPQLRITASCRSDQISLIYEGCCSAPSTLSSQFCNALREFLQSRAVLVHVQCGTPSIANHCIPSWGAGLLNQVHTDGKVIAEIGEDLIQRPRRRSCPYLSLHCARDQWCNRP